MRSHPYPLLLCVVALWVAAAAAPLVPTTATAQDTSGVSVEWLFDKAREAFGDQDMKLAEKFYQEILIRERGNVQAMLELANVYERTGKLEYARGLLVRAEKLDPDNPEITNRIASVQQMLAIVLGEEVDRLMATGQFDLAIPKLSQAIAIQGADPELRYKKAKSHFELGQFSAALDEVKTAIDLDQRTAYYDLRREIRAEQDRREIAGLTKRAEQLIALGTPQANRRALEVLGNLLEADPDNEWARGQFVQVERIVAADSSRTQAARVAGSAQPVRTETQERWAATAATVLAAIERNLTLIVLLIVAFIVFRSPLTPRLAGAFRPRPLLAGSLKRFSLPEILLMLNAEPHTGVVFVKGRSGSGKIYFEGGDPCHCVAGKQTGTDALLQLLADSTRGHFSFTDDAIPLDRTIDTPLSVVLIEHARRSTTVPPAALAGMNKRKQEPAKKSRMKQLLDEKAGVR